MRDADTLSPRVTAPSPSFWTGLKFSRRSHFARLHESCFITEHLLSLWEGLQNLKPLCPLRIKGGNKVVGGLDATRQQKNPGGLGIKSLELDSGSAVCSPRPLWGESRNSSHRGFLICRAEVTKPTS